MYKWIGDTTFGINGQPLAVLQVLAQWEPDFADWDKEFHCYKVDFETKPWYNGRERGVMVSMSRSLGGGPVMHITIFEHRNSDNLCCLKWETEHFYWNSPDADNAIEDAYGKGKTKYDVAATFDYLDIKKCVDWIIGEMTKFYGHIKEIEADKKQKRSAVA